MLVSSKGVLKTEDEAEHADGAVRVLSKEVSGLFSLLNCSQERRMASSREVN